MMREQLEQIKQAGLEKLKSCLNAKELDDIRVKILGKKGELLSLIHI